MLLIKRNAQNGHLGEKGFSISALSSSLARSLAPRGALSLTLSRSRSRPLTRTRLTCVCRPATVGAASRIEGIRPMTLLLLLKAALAHARTRTHARARTHAHAHTRRCCCFCCRRCSRRRRFCCCCRRRRRHRAFYRSAMCVSAHIQEWQQAYHVCHQPPL